MTLFSALLKGFTYVIFGAVKLVARAIGAVVGATRRLYAKSLTMPKPKSYFWLRFGPLASACVLVLLLPLAFSPPPQNLSVEGAASSSEGGTVPAPQSPSASAGVTQAATPTASPTADGPTPPGSTGEVVLAAGVVLPDLARTPGALNPDVTQADIAQTICVSGWT